MAISDELDVAGPRILNHDEKSVQSFEIELGRLITRLRLRYRATGRVDSVALGVLTKEKIAADLAKLRASIDAAAISEELRASLHQKVDAVERELKKGRSNLGPIYRLVGAIQMMAYPIAVGAVGTVDLLANLPGAVTYVESVVSHVTAERKAENDREHHLTGAPLLAAAESPKLLTDRSSDPVHIEGAD